MSEGHLPVFQPWLHTLCWLSWKTCVDGTLNMAMHVKIRLTCPTGAIQRGPVYLQCPSETITLPTSLHHTIA